MKKLPTADDRVIRLRSNVKRLAAAFGVHGHFAAVEVRHGHKRLRKK
jgi:hypothetical protein